MQPVHETVIIPDVHQNHRFLEKVLERHDLSTLGRLVFLGDYFDAKEAFWGTPQALEATLDQVVSLCDALQDRLVLLLGNHDVLYYFNREGNDLNAVARNTLYAYYGLPQRESLALAKASDMGAIWNRMQVAHVEQGYLLTHAGVTRDFWSKHRNVEQNVECLNQSLFSLLDERGEVAPLFRAGFARGGDIERGGPLWLDWNLEFSEEIGLPQIVGHTVGSNFRKCGRSYCLDARQQGYGILRNGEFTWVAV